MLSKLLFFFTILFTVGISILLLPTSAHADQTGSLLPQSDGFYTQLNPKSGTTHYTMVDESVCNGTSDYNSTVIVGNRDSYGITISSIPNGSTITQIDITPCASRNNSGGTNPIMNVFYKLNGINSGDSGSYSLTGTTPSSLSTTSFTGLSIIKSSSTTFEIGAVLTSGTKGVRLGRIATLITYTPLSSPSGLNISGVTQTQASLTWTDNSTNESGFNIERSPDGVSSWMNIGTTSANINTFTDTGLSANTIYYYRVQAYNAGGNSGYSNVNGIRTPPYSPIVTTSDATDVIAVTESSASATFNSIVNPNGSSTTGYYRYGTSNVACNLLPTSAFGFNAGSGTGDVSPNSVNVSLLRNTTYYYCVIAYNSGGTSLGNVVSFTTP